VSFYAINTLGDMLPLDGSLMVIILFGFLIVAYILLSILLSGHGIAKLENNHFKISLNGKKRVVKYDNILSIAQLNGRAHNFWSIRIKGERNITLHIPLGLKRTYQLEEFIKALKTKVDEDI